MTPFYYKDTPKAALLLSPHQQPLKAQQSWRSSEYKCSPNSSWEPWEGMDALMSGLWRGWNLICTSCRALKKRKRASLISLWITRKNLMLRRFLFIEAIPLDYALASSVTEAADADPHSAVSPSSGTQSIQEMLPSTYTWAQLLSHCVLMVTKILPCHSTTQGYFLVRPYWTQHS